MQRAGWTCTLLGMLAVAAAASPALQVAEARERFVLPAGLLKSRTIDVTVRDEARGKDLGLRVRVPLATDDHPVPPNGWPLVVFSHGAGGSRAAFGKLLDTWAAYGFASIAPTHADSLELGRRHGGSGGARLLQPEGRAQLRRSVDLAGRVADCRFILDKLDEIAKAVRQAGGPKMKVDRRRLAIAGHSAGAFTAQLCIGVKARARGIGAPGVGFKSIGDDRFKAAIIISGQGTASFLLGDDSWSELKAPIFVITGSLDASPPDMGHETPETRQHPFTKSRGVAQGGPPAYLMFIDGATHSSYQGTSRLERLMGRRPTTDVPQIQDAVAAGTVLFLQAHINGDADARKLLDSKRLSNTIPGKVRYEWK